MPKKKKPAPDVFWCQPCFQAWEQSSGNECPECGAVSETLQPRHFLSLAKTRGKQTGPKTQAGMDRAIQNLRANNSGPTGDSAARSRLNATKHGRHLKVSPLFPAKHNSFLECPTCPVNKECGDGQFKYCPIRTNAMLDNVEAFVSARDNPEGYESLANAALARVHAVFMSCLEDISKQGTILRETTLSQGGTVTGRWVLNPAIDVVAKLMGKLGYEADQQQITPKSRREGVRDNALSEFLSKFAPERLEAGDAGGVDDTGEVSVEF